MTEEKTTQENKLLSPIYNNSNNNKAGVNIWLLKCQISKQTFS